MKKAIRTNKIIVGCFKVFDLKLYIVQPWKKFFLQTKKQQFMKTLSLNYVPTTLFEIVSNFHYDDFQLSFK
jgi:hypothetical protein